MSGTKRVVPRRLDETVGEVAGEVTEGMKVNPGTGEPIGEDRATVFADDKERQKTEAKNRATGPAGEAIGEVDGRNPFGDLSRAELLKQASRLELSGVSKMKNAELADAVWSGWKTEGQPPADEEEEG